MVFVTQCVNIAPLFSHYIVPHKAVKGGDGWVGYDGVCKAMRLSSDTSLLLETLKRLSLTFSTSSLQCSVVSLTTALPMTTEQSHLLNLRSR